MNKKNLIFLFFAVAIFFTSCVSTNKSQLSSPVYAPNVYIDPIKADVNVDTGDKLTGTSTSTFFMFFMIPLRIDGDNQYADGIRYSSSANSPFGSFNPLKGAESKVKAAAAYKAMESSDADILVNPQYSITVENKLIIKKVTAEVTGWSGKFTKFYQEDENENKNVDIKLNITTEDGN